MNKVFFCCMFLIVVVFPSYAVLFHDSPALSFSGPIEKRPGYEVQVRLDKVLADVRPVGSGQPSLYGGIQLLFFWCLPDGTQCNAPLDDNPEGNVLARVSPLCREHMVAYNFNTMIDCLHSQIGAGLYTAKVPSKTYGGGNYSRGKVCLNYLYNMDSSTQTNNFALNDNDCYLSPHTNEWCSLVTPTVNFDFGTLVSSRPRGVRLKKTSMFITLVLFLISYP